MAWTAPLTAAYNVSLTALQWNAHVRDNSNETMPAKATQTAGRWFVASGVNAIAQRTITSATVATSQTTTSTTYADLTTDGPSVTADTGTRALVFWGVRMENSSADAGCFASVAVSSATTLAASDDWAQMGDGMAAANANQFGMFHLFDNLTAGSNIFKIRYRVTAGTGTFSERRITVVAM